MAWAMPAMRAMPLCWAIAAVVAESAGLSELPGPAARAWDLLDAVQRQRIFADGKTFVDRPLRADPEDVLKAFQSVNRSDAKALKDFVELHFEAAASFHHDFWQRKRFGGGRKVIMADPWESASSSSEDEMMSWEAVQHFVVVETGLSQSCNSEEIRGLLHSISASTMAPKQISVFFSVKTAQQAQALQNSQNLPEWNREFANKLKKVELLNMEPKGGSAHGRSGAENWIVSQLLERAKGIKAQDHLILVTRTTVDSWFHPEYFPAVTFAFLNTGAKRNLTIYQPPILFLKDYYSQSWLTRYACLFLAQSSLASLTDPMGMPLPKSTCTMVMALMRSIDHSWDPNLSVRPYNIGIWTKCWIGTIGRMNLQPIFLPVYRSGCNPVLDDTFTRQPRQSCICIGAQMHGPLRAQVLSVLELVHMWTAMPLACCGRREGSEGMLKKRRIFSLMLRSLLPFGSVFWAHWVLSTWFLVVSLNALSLIFRLYHWPPDRGGAFLLGVTAAVLNLPLISVVSHVDLLKLFKDVPPSVPVLASAIERTPATHSFSQATSFRTSRDSGECQGFFCQYICLTACLRNSQHGLKEPWIVFVSGPLFFFLSLVEECRLAVTLTFAEESGPPKLAFPSSEFWRGDQNLQSCSGFVLGEVRHPSVLRCATTVRKVWGCVGQPITQVGWQ
eukprot:s1449_g2.t1